MQDYYRMQFGITDCDENYRSDFNFGICQTNSLEDLIHRLRHCESDL